MSARRSTLQTPVRNMTFSREKLDKLEKMPTWFIYYYMCFIRVLLSF